MKYIVFDSAGEMPAILDDSVHVIPDDAIELDVETYESLLIGSENGSVIVLVNGKVGLKPPPAIDQIAVNTAIRDGLLVTASLLISPLQDAIDLDDATAAEIALLKLWKKYRVAVNRADLTLDAPSWPVAPA